MDYEIRDDFIYADGKPLKYVQSTGFGPEFAPIEATQSTSRPKILMMHYTAGTTAESSAHWWQIMPQDKPASAHVVIDRDGTAIQCVPLSQLAWHAGRTCVWYRGGQKISALNSHSFGIELANLGWVTKVAGGWESESKIAVPSDKVLVADHHLRNPNSAKPLGWEIFPQVQIDSAVNIARAFVHTFGIDEIIGHDDVRVDKADPGPAFDMIDFRKRVFVGKSPRTKSVFEVNVAEGLILRAGPAKDHTRIELLPQGTRIVRTGGKVEWWNVDVFWPQQLAGLSGWVNSNYLE